MQRVGNCEIYLHARTGDVFAVLVELWGTIPELVRLYILKKAKNENINLSTENNKLSDELNKLNELHQSGALTQEEFEKAKNKLLND